MPNIHRRIYAFSKDVVFHFNDVHVAMRSAALAYTTVLSAVPLAVMGLGILSAFPVFETYSGKMQELIFSHFVAASADSIQSYLHTFASKAAGLSATSVFFLLITAVMLIFTMENAFNVIWRVNKRRHGVTAFLIYWSVLTLLPIVIGTGFALSIYLYSLPYIKGTAEALSGIVPFLKLTPVFFEWVGFTTLYITLPNTKVLFRDASIGALVAAILFEIVKRGFGFYITHFSTYEFIYGALAALPIFLVWIYFSWLIILFGAVITHIKQNNRTLRKNV